MSTEELVLAFHNEFVNLIVNNRDEVIDILNQSGFPTSFDVSNEEYIASAVKAMATSESFKDKIINLMELNARISNFKTFAPQPEKGGGVLVLGSDLVGNINGTQDFLDFPIFKKCD